MNIRTAILTFASSLLLCAAALQAQQPSQQNGQLSASVVTDAGVAYASSTAASPTSATAEPSPVPVPAPVPAPPSGGGGAGSANDDQWHLSVSPYLFFPGVHGTIGAFGREAGFR